MVETKKTKGAQDVLEMARAGQKDAIPADAKSADEFELDFWSDDPEDDTESAPLFTLDGSPRRYWQVEKGATIFGYYLGCEVIEMPKFGKPDEREERGFFLLEVAPPRGYSGTKPYGVKVKAPRSTKIEIANVGDVVHVGIRSRLQLLTLLSTLDVQPLIGIRASGKSKTSRGFNLWDFDVKAWDSKRMATRLMSDRRDVSAMFGAQDRGLYAARYLFGLQIPEDLLAIAERQSPKRALQSGVPAAAPALEAPPAQKQLEAPK